MFENQVVWITGASSGIGEALALALANRGARLVLSARREKELERVKAACVAKGLEDRNVLVLPFDITEFGAAPDLTARVLAHFGQIDLLINNAGVSQRSLCVDTDLHVYRQLLDIDVMGQIALTKAVLPFMIERHAGHIAIMSSVAGKVGSPLRTGYCAAKHAVMGFYDALRAEVDMHNIKVTTITPGYIRTKVAHNALAGDGQSFGKDDPNIEKGMPADKAAAVILRGMEKGKPEIPVGDGREMNVLWLKRFFPNAAFKAVAKMGAQIQQKRNSYTDMH